MSVQIIELVVAGPQGVPGTPGSNTEAGGATREVLMKNSAVDYDVQWDYVDAQDTTFTSGSDLTSVKVGDALDEVGVRAKQGVDDAATAQADADTNKADISDMAVGVADNKADIATNAAAIAVNIAAISTNTGNITINADDILAVEVEAAANTSDIADNVLAITGINTYVGVDDSTGLSLRIANNETVISSNYMEVKGQLKVEAKPLIHVDTLIVEGLFDVDTGMPYSGTSGRLTVIKYVDTVSVQQKLFDKTTFKVYTRISVIGDGSDWGAWTTYVIAYTAEDVSYDIQTQA